MTHVTLDATLAEQLCKLSGSVELRDPEGRTIGRFVPSTNLSGWVPISPDVSEEELDRREKSDKWYTSEEVREHLKNLEKENQ